MAKTVRGNIDAEQLKAASRLGDSSIIQMTDGSYTSGNVPMYAADGSLTDSGSAPGGGGGGFPFTFNYPPDMSGWTTLLATATRTDTGSGVTFTGSNNQAWKGYDTTTLTAPWAVEIAFSVSIGPENFCEFGLFGRDSSSGKYLQFLLQHQNGGINWVVNQLNTDYSYNLTIYNKSTGESMYSPICSMMRIRDNNTTRFYEISADLNVWLPLFSHGRTTWATVNQIGIDTQGSTNNPPAARLMHFKKS